MGREVLISSKRIKSLTLIPLPHGVIPFGRLRRSRAQVETATRGPPRFAQDKPPEKRGSPITPLVTIGLDAEVGHLHLPIAFCPP
jgi:hypothetical protein